MGNYPVAIPTAEESFIRGELYKIINEDEVPWAIAQLDDYEGVNSEEDEQVLYKREIASVYKDDGTTTEAWVYWYNGDVTGKPVIPSGDVLEYAEAKNFIKS